MSVDFPKFFKATKSIPVSHDWEEAERDYLKWVGPLDLDGVTVEGLQVRVTAHTQHPDEAVAVQLEYHPAAGRPEQLARVEWRPLRPHNNNNKGPDEWRLRAFRQTHIHRFEDNWLIAEQRMRTGNLPIAIPFQDLDSYEEFLDKCGKELNIENMSIVPLPPWHPRMF